jgi:16S rRNA (guanine527-N7)-methyltransferase
MALLSPGRIAELIEPYFPLPSALLIAQLSVYLDLLVKWNARTNLSAIREPEEMVRRHFGESLFAARHLPAGRTLLDLGSGAGFPGLPIALAHPGIQVTLAESQNKKAAFLREAVRTLGVSVEVFAGRAEEMAAARVFDIVAMRAVDRPEAALEIGRGRLAVGGSLLHLRTAADGLEGEVIPLPGSEEGVLHRWRPEAR